MAKITITLPRLDLDSEGIDNNFNITQLNQSVAEDIQSAFSDLGISFQEAIKVEIDEEELREELGPPDDAEEENEDEDED